MNVSEDSSGTNVISGSHKFWMIVCKEKEEKVYKQINNCGTVGNKDD